MNLPNASEVKNREALVANGILVVDDDPLICELIRDVLESAEINLKRLLIHITRQFSFEKKSSMLYFWMLGCPNRTALPWRVRPDISS